MSPELTPFAPLFLVSPLLAAMALNDLRHLKISNRLVLAMLAVFILSAPLFLSVEEISFRAVTGLATFALGVAGFALRVWGGGDVKAIAVLVLFVPGPALLLFAYAFSFSMAIGMIAVFSGRKLLGHPDAEWSAMRPNAGYPMGVSIAMSGLVLLLVAIALTH